MKISIIVENFVRGGIETFLINLLNYWPDKDTEFKIITNKSNPSIKAYKDKIFRNLLVETHKIITQIDLMSSLERMLKKGLLANVIIRLIIFIVKYYIFFIQMIYFKKLVLETETDIYFIVNGGFPGGSSCNAFAIAAAKICNKPIIYNYHNIAVPTNLMNCIQNRIDKTLINHVSKFVTVSKYSEKSILKRFSFRNQKEKIMFIHNGINIIENDDYKGNIRKELKMSKDEKIILMLASYEERKGHLFLLDTFKKIMETMKDVSLLICGYGSEKDIIQIKKYACKIGILERLYLLSYRADGHDLIKQADVLAIPSREYESFGLIAVEGLALGTPVAATRVGGLPEVVEDYNGGLTVKYGDTKKFAEIIIQLIKNKKLRDTMRKRGQIRYNKYFQANTMAKRYYNCICKYL